MTSNPNSSNPPATNSGTNSNTNQGLNLSFFESARDNQPKAAEASWEDLEYALADVRTASCTPETCKRSECTDKHGPAWSPGSYPEGVARSRDGVTAVAVLVLDIDHIDTDDQLAEIIDKFPFAKIIHASHSDRPGDRCVRIVIRLSEPVPGHLWPLFWQAVVAKFDIPIAQPRAQKGGLDAQTKDASRLYFLPSRPQGQTDTTYGDGTDFLYAVTEGPALDVHEFLTQEALVEPPPKTTDAGNHAPIVTPDTNKQGRDAALDVLSQAWPTQGRHQASLALAGALAHANWPQDKIAEFMHDLMDLVYGPGADPHPRKRDDQARDSALKVEQGQAVSGWPSLTPHIGEQALELTTKALGINTKSLTQTLLALAKRGPTKPTQDQVRTQYKHKRSQLLRKKQSAEAQHEAQILARILDHEQLAETGEDRLEALARGIRTLLKYQPEHATTDQLIPLLLHVYHVDIDGQDSAKPWADRLYELFDACAEQLVQEAQEGQEFVIEPGGKRIGKPENTLHSLDIAITKLKVRLKYDQFACKKLISIADQPWEVVEDPHVDGIWFQMEKEWDLQFGREKFARYLDTKAFDNAFHPVRDYLDSLEWDGVKRLDNWLHAYGQAPDTEYTRAIGRLVLVAAVRRVRQPGCKFDEMLILEGEQGSGKSTMIRALCPDENWFGDDLPLGEDSKRVIESTSGKWIVEGSELKGMSPKKVSELKGFLSRQIDEARMAFGREVKIAPRQWIVIGTTNDAQYLHDPTGLRRFWPVAVVGFDIPSMVRDRDQLWAEAAYYESQGESIRLDERFYDIAAQEQEERRVVDNIEAIIEEAFSGHLGRVKCLDVYQLLGKDPIDASPDEQRRVGEAMRRLGWKRTRRRIVGKPTYVYVKGLEADEDIALVVSGRKVIRAAGAPPPALPMTSVQGKVN